MDRPRGTCAPALLLLALVVPLLAGCLAQTPAAPADGEGGGEADAPGPLPSGYVLDRIEAFSVEAADGAVLRGHVYLPNGSGPFPVILNYSPYWNGVNAGESEAQATADGTSMQGSVHGQFGRLLEAGFAVALVNIRGTGESDGCNTWFDFEADGDDAYHVIEALADAPWSNGNVGMVGISWHGYTQYAALAADPPSLKAVAPASSVLDLWTLFTRRGPPLRLQTGPMLPTFAAFQAVVMGTPDQVPANRAACPVHAEQALAFNELTTTGDKTPWFQRRTAHAILRSTDVPMYVTNGLAWGEGHILQVDGLWPLLPGESRLVLGQWHHQYPDDDREEAYWDRMVGWFDHYLRDGPRRVETGFVEYQDTADVWRTSPTWPPAADRTRLFLSDGTVVADPGDVATSDQTFVATDRDPAPTTCTQDKALYVSPPLAEDVLLAGNLSVNLTLSSTAPNSNLGVYVWHVDGPTACPDAAALQRNPFEAQVGRALSDLRHRGGHRVQGEDFPVGTPAGVALTSQPFAVPVKAGEHLVVAVVGGTGELSPDPMRAALTVHTGPDVEAWLELPVVEGHLVFEGTGPGDGGRRLGPFVVPPGPAG